MRQSSGKVPVRDPALCALSKIAHAILDPTMIGQFAWPVAQCAKIEAIIPVELTEIVLGVSSEHYANAQAQQTAIVSQFRAHGEVLYPGLSITIPGDSEAGVVSPMALECLMCQPTTQGVFARDSDPRIVVVKNPAQSSALAHSNSHNGSELDDLQETDDSDLEQWDIGAEWFILGGSALESGRGKLVDAAFNQPWLSSAMHSSVLDETTAALNGRYVNLTAIALEAPLDGVQLVPKEFPGEDLANRGFMSLASLAKAGIVSGTWALVALDYASKDNQQLGAEQRAIRIFGLDKGAPPTGSLALPPILLHNICSTRKESGTKALGNYSAEIKVLLTPLGLPPSTPSSTYLKSVTKLPTTNGAAYQPPLHIAKKVVISRVSSPLSERRDLESIAFAALRKWLIPLETSQGIRPLRVVKTGDLIAVRIHLAEAAVRTSVALVAGTDAANRVRNNDSIMDPSFVDVDPASDLALDYPIVQESAHGAVASELVFFKVMHAEGFRDKHGTNRLQAVPSLDDDEDSDSDSDDDQSFVEDADSFDLCELDDDLDELDKEWTRWHWQTKSAGFIIEPDITNVVQSGAEHSFVPYLSAAAYIEAGEFFSGTGRDCSSAVPYADAFNQILRLAKTSSHPLALSRNLFCSLLLKGNPGTGKRTLVREVAKQLGVHLYELSCYDILSDTEDKTAQVLQMYFQNARRYTPCILHLRSVDALSQASNAPPGQDTPDDLPIARVLRSCISSIGQAHRETGFPIIVIATSNQPDKIPTALATAFRHEVELSVPDENTRLALLERIAAKSMPLAADTDLAYTAQQTASFVARDLAMLVKRAENRAWRRSQQNLSLQKSVCQPLRTRDALLSGLVITNEDLLGALGDARASMSDTLGVPKIPNVKWDDVGGLADAKKDILDTIRLPMEQPHLFASGLSTRSGLLFYGPPGTGKTLLAKAIATECGLNFFSCKGPELISPYIGESEANVRRIFQKAREASPCVIFFDELDSLAPKRGQQGDSGGVMDRIVSQLLAELDGMSGGGDSSDNGDDSQGADSKSKEGGAGASAVQVFAIGATNRPDLLDPALLRPGRFDKLVYLGVSETHDAQLNIIQALTRKFHLHPDLDLRDIAEKCPFHYTGADFYALCSDSLLKAMLRTVDEVDILVEKWNYSRGQLVPGSTDASDKTQTHYPVPMTPQYYLDHVADDTIKQVTVTTNDFERALDELIPSVSAEELVRYQSLRRQFDSTQKRQEQGPLHQNDELSTELLPSDVLENIQQSMHAQQETSQEITFGKDVDQTTDTKASTKQRCRKGKEREV
ncbi:peroxisomal assembly protein [Coemansia sp. RSA 521]|nr:peroxisomal assembly protein [Coemansia sp. RSA 521]